MKIRSGFVSNSSSSSFIIITKNKDNEVRQPIAKGGILKIPRDSIGETDFGRGAGTFHDFDSKLHFAILQALYTDVQDYIDMILSVLKKKFVGVKDIVINLEPDFYMEYDESKTYGEIDHDSVGNQYLEIFDTEDTLYNFLFMTDSYFHVGGDDEERQKEILRGVDPDKYKIISIFSEFE